ncbi:MAG: DUF6174 domain-containing protein [Microthrixaceae bacterium]
MPVDETTLDRAEVIAREAAWVAARPAAYTYEVETDCECPRAGTYRVTVEDEEILDVTPLDPGAERYRQYSPPTIDQAFPMLDEPLALSEAGEIPTGQASASFEAIYGYPQSFTVTGSGGLPSYRVEIRDFTPVDPAELIRPLPGLAVMVTNQSFADPEVDLTIAVDGEVMIERSYAVEGQHTYVSYHLALEPGEHQLVIRSDTGETHKQVVSLGTERRYLSVSYWGDDSSGADVIAVEESDEPFLVG